MKTILDILGNRHQTDKASGNNWHNYLDWYEGFLRPLRDKRVRLLEIGVGGGASLRTWRDYFLQGFIVGMDKEADRVQYAGERTEIEIGNQGSSDDLFRVADKHGPFDIVVDDAGHEPNLQADCYDLLLPRVNPGGLYILEDIGGSQCTEKLIDMAQKVIRGESGRVESIFFFKDTSVTRMKDG